MFPLLDDDQAQSSEEEGKWFLMSACLHNYVHPDTLIIIIADDRDWKDVVKEIDTRTLSEYVIAV